LKKAQYFKLWTERKKYTSISIALTYLQKPFHKFSNACNTGIDIYGVKISEMQKKVIPLPKLDALLINDIFIDK